MKYKTVFLILLFRFFSVNVMAQTETLQRQESFQYCRYDIDCRHNSFCYGNTEINPGRCRCKDNYIMADRNKTHYECLEVADGVDSSCSQDIQCQIKLGNAAWCDPNNKICRCNDESHLGPDNLCYKNAVIGDLCVSSHNCLLIDGTYGFCVDGKCSCNINHHSSEDGRKCFPSVPLGKGCIMSESCIHTSANCFDGICRCIAGYIESDNNTLCWKAASQIGDSCIETIQCSEYIKGSYCNNGECTCRNGYHGYGNECVMDAGIGEFCTADKECILTAELKHSIRCSDGICVCIEGITDRNGCIIISGVSRISIISGISMILWLLLIEIL